MAFSAPSGNYGASTRDRYQRVLDMAKDSEDGFYTGRPRQTSGGVARIDTSLLDREDDREAERARLMMTPGVRRGGSTATRPQADSPLNVGSSRRFERFGDTYSFDPVAAGEERGVSAAAAEGSAQKARYENLARMPGFTPRQAAKVVYGRGDAFDENDAAAALAQYVRDPSRETAATAIERGASPFSTPFTGGFDPEATRARPGTQAYMEMQFEDFRQREAEREARAKRMAELNAEIRQPVAQTALEGREAAAERRYAERDVQSLRGDMQRTLARRPKSYAPPEDFLTFRADSTATADALKMSESHLRELKAPAAPPAGQPVATPRPSPKTPEEGAVQFMPPAPTAQVQDTSASLKPPTPKLVQWATGDPGKKAYLAQQGYDVSRIP